MFSPGTFITCRRLSYNYNVSIEYSGLYIRYSGPDPIHARYTRAQQLSSSGMISSIFVQSILNVSCLAQDRETRYCPKDVPACTVQGLVIFYSSLSSNISKVKMRKKRLNCCLSQLFGIAWHLFLKISTRPTWRLKIANNRDFPYLQNPAVLRPLLLRYEPDEPLDASDKT